jgi:transposase
LRQHVRRSLRHTLIGPAEILVEGNRIEKVARSLGRPTGARLIDLSERTVSPGFIGTHVQLTMDTAHLALQTPTFRGRDRCAHRGVAPARSRQLARQDQACVRLMSVPGIGPVNSSAMVAAIGTGDVFSKAATSAPGSGWYPATLIGATNEQTMRVAHPGGCPGGCSVVALWLPC